MKKFCFFLFLLLHYASISVAQFNYYASNAHYIAGIYTDLAASGTAITTNFDGASMTFDDDNSSVQNIGFDFTYNGTTFTQFVLNTNGFIALGSIAPVKNDYSVLSGNINAIAAFNNDLDEASAAEYRVFTSGVAGTRVCSIQFKNLKEFSSLSQHSNINFQIKLYETSNNIELVYGSFMASVQAPSSMSAGIGIIGTTTGQIVYASKNGAASWSAAAFTSNISPINSFVTQNDVLPVPGTIFRFVAGAAQNDAQVLAGYTLARIPLLYGVPHTIQARVINTGAATLTDLPVTVKITSGPVAILFKDSKIVTIAPGDTALISFDSFSPTVLGNNLVTVSVPSDDDNTNNSKQYLQIANENTFSYADTAAVFTDVGFNKSEGMLLTRYTLTGSNTITNVKAHLGAGANIGNTVYAVVLDASGNIVGQSANYITTAQDLNTDKNFIITNPPVLNNTDFYVGLAQTANTTTGYFPLSTQDEADPARPAAYYFIGGLAGSLPKEITSIGRFMIEAVLGTPAKPPSHPYSNSQWTWVKGDSTAGVGGIYGTKGVADLNNKPGARCGSAAWQDSTGNFWLFGGSIDAPNSPAYNDLWKYSPADSQWTWKKGDDTTNALGVYGSIGTAAPANKPGGRSGSVSWTDSSGNFWLFGGGFVFFDGVNAVDSFFNDLWKYNPTDSQWTWIKGDNTANILSVYGDSGIAAANNKPGSRTRSISWKDNSGNLWLFGGYTYIGEGSEYPLFDYFNDLWKYNPASNRWTWMKGDTMPYSYGIYGTQGKAGLANKPGARDRAVSWKDHSGNLWLFGGYGYSADNYGLLNDLWKYDVSSNQWTWIKGENVPDVPGVYGTQGTAASTNTPGSRSGSVSWTDNFGNFWLLGGYTNGGWLHDLWKYEPSTNQWTWIKGNYNGNEPGVYGELGIEAPGNSPGGREDGVSWADSSGYIWLFGGNGYAASNSGYLNDLWKIFAGTIYVFTGTGAWNDPSNWLNGLVPPDEITSGMLVIINGTGQCTHTGDLGLETGGRLTIKPGKILNIDNGDLTNAGIMNGTGTLVFKGGSISALSSSGVIATPLKLINKKMYLSDNTNTTDSVILINGSTLKLLSFNINMHSGYLQGDSLNFIITNGTGTLTRYVESTPIPFHIGADSSSYTPVTISDIESLLLPGPHTNGLTAAGDDFSARVTNGIYTTGSAIDSDAVNKTWFISEGTPGGSDATITTQWDAEDELPGFDRTSCYIADFKECPPPVNCQDGYYDAAPRISALGTGAGPFTASRNGISDFANSNNPFIVSSRFQTFIFTGSGNWSDSTNWTIGIPPPQIIKGGVEVIIAPMAGGECIINGDIIVQRGGKLTVQQGQKLNINGSITIFKN